jgi:hypothetical protein
MRYNPTCLILGTLLFLTASFNGPTFKSDPMGSRSAEPNDQDYFYCGLLDESQAKRFFLTRVFSGDDANQRTYETQFSAYLAGRWGGVIGTASCHFDKSRSVAMMRHEDDKIAASRENRAVIETDWRP